MPGGSPPRRYPTRTCVACRTARPKRELVRVVRSPAGDVALDPTGKAPGRGAYVCDAATCRESATTKGALRRALEVPIPATLFGATAGAPQRAEPTNDEGGA